MQVTEMALECSQEVLSEGHALRHRPQLLAWLLGLCMVAPQCTAKQSLCLSLQGFLAKPDNENIYCLAAVSWLHPKDDQDFWRRFQSSL